MSGIETIRSVLIASIVVVAAAAWPGPAFALSEADFKACNNESNPSKQQRVAACTRVLNSKSLSSENRVKAHFLRGLAYSDLRQYRRGAKDFGAAIRLKPDYVVAYRWRSYMFYTLKEWDKYRDDCSAMIRLRGDALDYNCRAWAWHKLGQPKKGLKDALQAWIINPKLGLVWHTRGHLYEDLGERDKAIAAFRKAIELGSLVEKSKESLKRLGAAP